MSSPLDRLPLPMDEETQKLVEKCGSVQRFVLHRLRPWTRDKIPRGLKVISLNLIDRIGKAFFGGDAAKYYHFYYHFPSIRFFRYTRVVIDDLKPEQGSGCLRCTRSRLSHICIDFKRFEAAPTWKDVFDLVALICLLLIQAYSRYKGFPLSSSEQHLKLQRDALTRINEHLKL